MIDTLGFLELNSIARGIEAADQMLKAADVELLFAKPVCPGKYMALVAGETEAVHSAVATGEEAAAGSVVESLVLPRVHHQVIQAINLCVPPEPRNAVGVLEFFSVTQALISADRAVKAAEVTLIELRLGMGVGGKSYTVLTGDTAAVEQGVAAGAADAAEKGMLVAKVIIPNPRQEIFESLY